MAFDWKGLVAKAAPALSWALPGPFGEMAKGVLAKVFGAESADEKTLIAKMQGATPDDLIRLKQADDEFALKLQQMGLDYAKLANEDRANARAREIATKDWVTRALAITVMAMFGGTLAGLFRLPIPEANRDAVVAAFGILLAAVTTVLSYYFGSSSGSARKTELLGTTKGEE